MYKLHGKLIIRLSDGAFIPMANENFDYMQYLHWVADGNTPTPPDPLPLPVKPIPVVEDRIEAVELIINGIIS